MITVVSRKKTPEPLVVNTLRSRAKEYLVQRIRNGELTVGSPVPTIKKIAATLEVSTNVAFFALKDMKGEGWIEQVSNRRYRISRSAERLLLNRHLRIDFTSFGIDHIRHYMYQAIFNYLIRAAHGKDSEIRCVLETTKNFTTDAEERSDAIVVADWQPADFRSMTNGPVIGLDQWADVETDCIVGTNHFLGGEIMAGHLWERGCRKVVYWDLGPEWGDKLKGIGLRRIGFLKGWVEAGGDLSAVEVLPVILSDVKLDSLLDKHLEGTDAFFSCTDVFALTIWDALKNKGIKVPDDIAIAGFDGSYEALTHDPVLTTVKQPCEEIAKRIMDLIIDVTINCEQIQEKKILVPPELVVGGSTG